MQGHLVSPPTPLGAPGRIFLLALAAAVLLAATMAVTIVVRDLRHGREASGATLGREAERWLSARPPDE